MPRHQIKRYIQDSACAECGRHVKGWGRAKCDNCGAIVCRQHRPLFSHYWACSHCRNSQHQVFASTETHSCTAAAPSSLLLLSTTQDVQEAMRLAEVSDDAALVESLIEALVREPS